jgi:hypothetical protein
MRRTVRIYVRKLTAAGKLMEVGSLDICPGRAALRQFETGAIGTAKRGRADIEPPSQPFPPQFPVTAAERV